MRILLFLALLAVPTWAQGTLHADHAEGRIVRMRIGLDSCRLWVRTASGVVEWSAGHSLDWIPSSEMAAYQALLRSTPGKDWPDAGDTLARVRVCFIGKHLLKYQVLEPARELWGVVIASKIDFAQAYQEQLVACRLGFEDAATLESARYPRMQPGYQVTLAGLFPDQASARPCLKRARERGWHDAYCKRIR